MLTGEPRATAANFAGNFVVGGVGAFKAMGRRRSPARQGGGRSAARQRPASAMAALRSVEEEEHLLLRPARADSMLGAYADVC
jgi:hypothetical protein